MIADKKRVLFVCIGNACRSQMAEGFATAYGSDVMVAASAGLAPAGAVHPVTVRAMAEKNIDIEDHFPKALRHLSRAEFDLVVNMSGSYLPNLPADCLIDWDIADPVYMDYEDHCEVRDEIERRVMGLILELRRGPGPRLRGQGSGRLDL
ncbi:MAG TPA: arsenate reductase ArsC [Candidatus Acidoferrales bacterium]|nr:arsenate reductase ArsC [Candidatus Acidoferrales bacterium]